MKIVEVEPIKEAEELCDKIQEYAITRYFINEFTCTIHPNIDKDLKFFINSFLIMIFITLTVWITGITSGKIIE